MHAILTLAATWGSLYANHAALRTIVAFVHVGALVGGGGIAVATDRATLIAASRGASDRLTRLDDIAGAHRIVLGGLALIVASGALLFAADLDTFWYSRFFWIKMALVALLVVNGAVLQRAETRARRGEDGGWRLLRLTSAASIVLWLTTT